MYLIVAALLGLLLISGIFGKRNLARIHVELNVPDEIYAGMRFPLSVRLVNGRKHFPAFLMRVSVDGTETLFPFVDGDGRAAKLIDITAPQRGLHRLNDIYVSSVFPFNFFVRYKTIKQGVTVTVFPRPVKYGAGEHLAGEEAYRGDAESEKKGDGPDIISLRNYLPGDPLKYIDWKATARTGHLKTKELAASLRPPVLIEWEKIPVRNVEARLSAVTFLILELMRSNRPVGLKIEERLYKPDLSRIHKLTMLRELAVYGQGDHGRQG